MQTIGKVPSGLAPSSDSLIGLAEQIEKSLMESHIQGCAVLARMRGESPTNAQPVAPGGDYLAGRLARVLAKARDVYGIIAEVDAAVGAP